MSRDEDSDALIAISPRHLTKVALQLEREAEEAAERRMHRSRAQTEPMSNPTDEEQRLRDVEDGLRDLAGKDGNGGLVGGLTKRVDAHDSRTSKIVAGVLASLMTAAGAIYWAGREDGAGERESEFLRAEVASLKAEVRELRALLPAYRPSPWRPQGDDP